MGRAEQVIRHNKVLFEKGLVDSRVENTDIDPVVKICRDIGMSDKDVLDVGCATGALASALEARLGGWRSYVGVDLGPFYVSAFNTRNIAKASAMIGNATNLPIEESSKDAILCLFVLQHLSREEGDNALRELKRVARQKAELVIGLTVNPDEKTKEKPYASQSALAAGAEEIPTTIWNEQEFEAAVQQAGFSIIERIKIPWRKPLEKLYMRARVDVSRSLEASQ